MTNEQGRNTIVDFSTELLPRPIWKPRLFTSQPVRRTLSFGSLTALPNRQSSTLYFARRKRARCCERADWLREAITPSSSDTDRSLPSDSSLSMRIRFALLIARRTVVNFDCSPSMSGSRAIVPSPPSWRSRPPGVSAVGAPAIQGPRAMPFARRLTMPFGVTGVRSLSVLGY